MNRRTKAKRKKKTKKQRVKRVKAWCVLNHKRNGIVADARYNREYVFGAATLKKEIADEYVKRSNDLWDEEKKVIPCTITYKV